MKLVSLNIEGKKHLDLVKPFLAAEAAEIVCLTEAPDYIQNWLMELDYSCSFAPMCRKKYDNKIYTEGLLIASKMTHTSEIIPYFVPSNEVELYNHDNRRLTQRHIILYATIGSTHIALTHFTWNPNGEIADEHQITDMEKMLATLVDKPPHILCGDFNIPRTSNRLYTVLAEKYTDNIPLEYTSSLDQTLHRKGKNSELQKLFKSFMVDYLFTQDPISVTDTKLQFGVSDHAAVVTQIYQ